MTKRIFQMPKLAAMGLRVPLVVPMFTMIWRIGSYTPRKYYYCKSMVDAGEYSPEKTLRTPMHSARFSSTVLLNDGEVELNIQFMVENLKKEAIGR